MVVLVVLYHAVAAYAIVAPHWIVHDTNTFAADIIRELSDVFMIPILFFAAGYLALVSLKKKGAWKFLKDKVKRLLVPWALAVFIIAPLSSRGSNFNLVIGNNAIDPISGSVPHRAYFCEIRRED